MYPFIGWIYKQPVPNFIIFVPQNIIINRLLHMDRPSISHFFQKLNQIPLETNEILHQIRRLDKQVLKLHLEINKSREEVLNLVRDFQNMKHHYRRQQKLKSQIKFAKNQYLNLQNGSNIQNQNVEPQENEKQNNNPDKIVEINVEIAEKLRNIGEIHQQMLDLSQEKIQLANTLYNHINEPTQYLQKYRAQYFSNLNSSQSKGCNLKRKTSSQHVRYQFSTYQPCYCYCKRPLFGQMVQCGSQHCLNQLFDKKQTRCSASFKREMKKLSNFAFKI